MAGLFSDIANFFTGDEQNQAADNVKKEFNNANALQDQGKNTSAAGTSAAEAGIGTLQQNAQNAQDQGQRLQGQQNIANRGVQQSIGANAAEGTRLANQAAQGLASQNATLSATQAARQALSAARTGGLNQGQAALAAGQGTGANYLNAYQQGLGQGLNTYNEQTGAQQANANSLANQAQGSQSLSNQAATGAGGLGTSLASIGTQQQLGGINAGLNAAGIQTQQANTDTAAGGALAGSLTNTIGDTLGKIIPGLKDGTDSAQPGGTLVGEKGTEFVPDMPAGTKVMSNVQLRKIVRKAGGPANPSPAQIKRVIAKRPDLVNQTSGKTPGAPDEGKPDLVGTLSKIDMTLEKILAKLGGGQEAG